MLIRTMDGTLTHNVLALGALWDALMDLEEKMRFAESPKLTVWTNISFLFIFDKNHKIRKQMKS